MHAPQLCLQVCCVISAGMTLVQHVQRPVPLSTLQSMSGTCLSSTFTPIDAESQIQLSGPRLTAHPVAEQVVLPPAGGQPGHGFAKPQEAEEHGDDVAAEFDGTRVRMTVCGLHFIGWECRVRPLFSTFFRHLIVILRVSPFTLVSVLRTRSLEAGSHWT